LKFDANSLFSYQEQDRGHWWAGLRSTFVSIYYPVNILLLLFFFVFPDPVNDCFFVNFIQIPITNLRRRN